MAEIVLTQLNKHYGTAHHAVKDVNLTIADKEFVVLVGPSGCGKSTTLRMIAGLEDISTGEIRIGSQVVNRLPPKDRDVAMVFQNYALYQHMTVYDNLAFGLRNKKIDEAKIKSEIDRAAEILGLNELMRRKPKQLSGGQQQRVALGRCIVRKPKVFLFDEPLSNLDAKLRTLMRLEIKRLRTRIPTTSVFVTHDQVEAMTLGDRVVVMKDGNIQQVGTPLEVYSRPANKFVASFIGAPSMNFIRVTLRSGEGGALFASAPGLDVRIPAARAVALAAWQGKELTLGIRPEHLSVAGAEGGAAATSGDLQIIGNATVDVVEQLGVEIVLEARLASFPLTLSRIDANSAVASGDNIRVATSADHLHFFDTDTELSIR
ncbi:ABC transporter ATP-binding protein [Achromobacter deleyi]|uniref:ABC transporter ATP-binding protein n=1 Tax=Achromobacter deleyi TaxID=1353891 RepID=UPI0014922B44|nr:sn-glycerol-3-phosphate ABC transporter ATP-binding protein UgpC [Achromobacter deleyi]QVQ26273.1 sn-glycerol-3-phosphate ABC transporter ATP-binding protein UgpC [Achromobacter deleyi]UIP21835.1 sn-glycerol-3-phosphate ABC transporter ATP-binding protein UgpC [Achromobacter deleyi]